MSSQAWSKGTWPSHNGQVQNDLTKMTERFFYTYPKWVFFLPRFLILKIGILVVVGHQYPTSNIFLCVILITKCLPDGPSCSFFITIYVFVVVKHHRNLLFWPILYNSPFFNVKGSIILTNLYFVVMITCPKFVIFSKTN